MEKRWDSIDFRYLEPCDQFYEEEMKKLDQLLKDFCVISELDYSKVQTNIRALKQVIRRVDMRCLYFKIFHDGMEINEYKLTTGLFAFWIIKLHPFWLAIDDASSENDIEFAEQFNEKFAVHIVMSILSEYNVNFIQKGENLLKAYIDELTYSFRYRDLSKESMFLMFDPFYYLYFLDSTMNKEGVLKL